MGWSLISIISLKMQSMRLVSLARILVSSCILPQLMYPDDTDEYTGGAL
jgi:hypothetical protein